MRTRRGKLTVAIAAGALALAGLASPAHAAAGKNACAHVLSAPDLQSGHTMTAQVNQDVAAWATSGKAGFDILAHQTPTATDRAAAAAHDAVKEAMFRDGEIANAGISCGPAALTSGTATYISWMYQYGQVTNYYCGPAVVSEFSATVPGSSPYNLSQYTVANYMGTTTDGTNWSQETNGLNYYVGTPDFGWNFYGMVWMSDPPTSAQQTAFFNHLSSDVSVSSPIAGLAYEVAYGPHLVGHPVSQTIGHWLEIGGYDTGSSQVWYADSATTVWSTVPPYSWFDMYTMEVILGGAGYIW